MRGLSGWPWTTREELLAELAVMGLPLERFKRLPLYLNVLHQVERGEQKHLAWVREL
jgi:hypothetical protein